MRQAYAQIGSRAEIAAYHIANLAIQQIACPSQRDALLSGCREQATYMPTNNFDCKCLPGYL
jgi:hypothetical protein